MRINNQTFLIIFCFDSIYSNIRAWTVLPTLPVANLAEYLTLIPRVNLSHCQLSRTDEACRTFLMKLHSIRDYFLCFENSTFTSFTALCIIP